MQPMGGQQAPSQPPQQPQYPPPYPAQPYPNLPPAPPPKKGMSTAVKVVIVVVLAVVIIAIIVAAASTPASQPATVSYAVRVNLPGGCWSGAAGIDGNSASYQGCDAKTISLSGSCQLAVVAVMQKGYDNTTLVPYPGTMTVDILKNGQAVKSGSTSADYGAVSVSYSCM
jgi:hypothetical protein